MHHEDHKQVRSVSRSMIKKVWDSLQNGKQLEEPEQKMAGILSCHSEYSDFWKQADVLNDSESVTEDGINPFLHLHIHFAVETQLAKGDPREVTAVADALKKQGLVYHEIIHKIGIPFTAQLFQAAQEKKPFNREAYIESLKELLK